MQLTGAISPDLLAQPARQRGRTPRRDVDRAIAALAAGQHGVVTAAQLADLGISSSARANRARDGRLHRVHHGVFAVGHPALTRRGRMTAAVFACGDGAALSHRSAADLWGLRRDSSAAMDVISPTRAGRSRRGIRVHRADTTTDADLTEIDGIPCTTLERTLLDLAEVVHIGALEYAVHRAQSRKRALSLPAMHALLERCPGKRGAPILRRLLADPGAAVHGELARRFLRICRRACRAAGAPMPQIDYWVAFDLTQGGHGIEVDFAWPDRRLVVETDGREHHDTARAFENDRLRDRRLLLAGWRSMRFTWRHATEDAARSERELIEALVAPPIPIARPAGPEVPRRLD